MTRAARRRRGSAYVLVVSVATVLVVTGLAGVLAVQLRLRESRLERDWQTSGVVAMSALDQKILEMATDPWWRTVHRDHDDVFTPEVPFGGGFMSWRFDDLVDGDLDDDNGDPVRIIGRGRVGETRRAYSVIAWPIGESLDVLRTAVHAGRDLTMVGVVDVRGGPASANGNLTCDQLIGDAEAATVTASVGVSGSVTTPAPPKPMPSSAIFDVLKSMAVDIGYGSVPGGIVEEVVISPGHNPFGSGRRSVDGIYRLKPSTGSSIRIRRCRLEATLLVELSAGSKLIIDPEVVWRPARAGLPALIVKANGLGTQVEITSDGTLDEFTYGVNFNPTHTPHYDTSDTDTTDAYPASINGTIHVIRSAAALPANTKILAPRRITGCIVADGDIEIETGSILVADQGLLSAPALGYTTARDPGLLLVNGDMEAGLTGWSPFGGATSLRSGSGGHAGDRIEVRDRSAASHGLRQDVTAQLESGTSYGVDLWLKMSDVTEDARVALEIDSTGEGTQWFTATSVSVGKAWTRFTGVMTPTWTGTISAGRLVVMTTTTPQDFLVDDVMLTAVTPGPPPATLVTVPATWRVEPTVP